MKQKRIAVIIFYAMRITFLQIVLALIFTFSSYASRIKAQAVLNKPVTVMAEQKAVKKVLAQIQKQTNVKFTYSSDVIDINRKISCSLTNKKLVEFFNEVLKPLDIDYRVIDDEQILLFTTPNTEKNILQASTAANPIDLTISGIVTNEKGEPLQGASITEKGTKNITVTDAGGNFKLKVKDVKTIIIISYTGYKTKEVVVDKEGKIAIVLAAISNVLDDIVVVGYGTQKKRDLTGSVSTIKSEEIAQSKVTSFQEAIQGKMAGVRVSSISGEPGSGLNISIRGASSIFGGVSPLYVIDGVPYDANASDIATASIGNPTASNPLAALNPVDIESISVLKDASATAIYGSRGANGVIMITTKSGKSGKTQIDYESYATFSSTTKKLGVLSPNDWLNYEKIVNPNTLLFYRDTNRDGLYNSLDSAVDLNSLEKHDWQNEILKTGFTQSHNISISGKNGNTAYSGGIGYLNQGAIIENNNYQRYNVRLKIDHDQSKNLKLGLNIQSAYTSLNGATQSGGGAALFNGVVQNLVISKPVDFYDPVWDRAGQYISPITMINNAYKNVSFSQSNLSGYVNYQIVKHLTLNISGGGIITNSNGKEFYGKLTTWGVGDNGLGILQQHNAYSLFNTNQLTYEKWINKNNYINVMVAFETNLYNFETIGLSKSNFADESTGVNDISKGAISKSSYSYRDQNRRLSYFGRLNYTFLAKHLLTATFRADGSDKFGPNNRFGYFPSIAYSWLAINERFMSSQKLFSNLKFRLSYGQTGNDRIPSYRYLSVLENTYYNGTLGLSPASQANPNLKWETTAQFNAGVDISLLSNRIEFNLDFYKKQTSNMLLPAPVPGRTGYIQQWQNIGRVDNTGVELQLSSKNINTKNFQWQTNFNISFNKNEVKNIGATDFIPITMGGGWITNVGRVSVGQPIGTAYGYEFDGVYQTADFTWQNNSDPSIPHYQRNYVLKSGVVSVRGVSVTPGSFKFKDLNGDGKIDLDNDRTTISHSSPKFFGGFNNTFKYKNFDLNVFFEGSYGNQIFNESLFQLQGGVLSTWMNITKDFYNNRWTPNNPTNKYGDFNDFNKTSTLSSSYYVEDGSYLRLKSLTLGYMLKPNGITNKIGIKSIRLYFTGSNLITWTKYSGYDPELDSGNPLLSGFDRISYPRAKSFTFGLNVSF